MAEQVNQRIEDMINEFEQMRRIELFNDEEIREISRKRKEYEYRIQRRLKEKSDYLEYITYELALIEEITIRRKVTSCGEKKKDIEYAIARRLNKLFKQFIYRFPSDLEIYFQYIKFCMGVRFDHAVSGIIGQMLQLHGDKPKSWQLAAKWESEEQNNLVNARDFLLKGIHRHPDADYLYLDLFKIELTLLEAEENDKETQLKRADVIWRNGLKNVEKPKLICDLCDLSIKYDTTVASSITNDIKKEIWKNKDKKEIWTYIANNELKGCHWQEIEEFVSDCDENLPIELRYYIAVYEEALKQFPEEKLCTEYIYGLLSINDSICNDLQKISAVKHAWVYGNDSGLLSNDMYKFGIEMLKLEGLSDNDLLEIIDSALKQSPQALYLWEEKLMLNRENESQMLIILKDAEKVFKSGALLILWNIVLENVQSKPTLNNLYKKFHNCDGAVILSIKPKLLKKMYEHNGLKAARDLYEELIRTPPTQLEVHQTIINIEKLQEKVNFKQIRKYYEYAVQHHGKDDVDLWLDYMKFETNNGNAQVAPSIYRRAMASLKTDIVDNFVNKYTLSNVK